MRPWALVSPASRGIGLHLVRRLLQTTDVPIVATARKDLDRFREHALQGLEKDGNFSKKEDRLHVLKLDVLDEQSVVDAARQTAELFPSKSSYVHLALCIPGILYPEKSPAQIDHDQALLSIQTNVLGPLLMLKHFSSFLPSKATTLATEELRNLPPHATWANMSARLGSVSDNRNLGGWYSYRASKAAVNQITKTFDNHLRTTAGEKAICVALHPGTVKTDFSRQFWTSVPEGKLFSVEFAAEKLLSVVNELAVKEGRGRCWDWQGIEIQP